MGVAVVAIDHCRDARGMHSRYIRERIFVDESHAPAVAALEALDRHHGSLLIATNDHYVMLVAQNHERLSRSFVVTTPPWAVVRRLMDKRECYTLAGSLGVGVPRFFTPASVAELDRIVAGLDFSNHAYLLTKTLPLGAPTDGHARRFTRVAGCDAETLRARCLEALTRMGQLPMISEVVPGRSETCIGVSVVLDRTHRIVAFYCVQRLQLRPYEKDEGFVHPYELGATVLCQSTHDDEALDAAGRLLREVGYYGAATVEFRRDASDGALRLIKVDPRFVRATSLSAALGVDIAAALFRAFTGRPVAVPRTYPDGVSWVWLTWLLDTLRWQLSRMGWRRAFVLFRQLRTVRAAAYLSASDPMPFLVDVGRWLPRRSKEEWRGLLGKAGRLKSRLTQVSAPDV